HDLGTALDAASARRRTQACVGVCVVGEAHLADVPRKIADLKAMERVLRETVARCAGGTASHWPLIDALYRDGVDRQSSAPVSLSSTQGRTRSVPTVCSRA